MNSDKLSELTEAVYTAFEARDEAALLEIIEKVEALDTQAALALTATARGLVEYLRGHYPAALDHYQRALAIHEELADRRGIARIINNIGNVYNNTGDYPAALDHYRRAISSYEELGNRPGIARVTGNIGNVYWNTGDYPAAVDHYQRALAVLEEIGDRLMVALVTGNIANVYTAIGDYPAALDHYQRALAIHEELADRPGIARVTGNFGIMYSATGDYPAALKHYHSALTIAEELNDRRGIAKGTSNIAVVYWRTGDYPAALKHFHGALTIHEELGDRSGIALVTGNIGTVYNDTDDYSVALDHYQRALAIYEELGDRSGIAVITGNLGATFFEAGNYPEAMNHYQRAMALCLEIGIPVEGDTTRMVATYIRLGDYTQANAMLATLDAEQIQEPEIRIGLAQQHAKLLEHDGDGSGAMTALQQALVMATEHGLRAKAAECHKALRDLAQRQNDFTAYIEHNNEYTRITEEINGKQTAQRLAMMEAEKRIEAERKEREKERAVLYSTLPKAIADRVVRGEQVTGDHFENACVLFTDIVGFTSHSSSMQPGDVVTMLANMFAAFDTLSEAHGVVKVKTMGDSYMCFKGDADATTNASSVAALALALKGACGNWPDGSPVQIRLGIHIGTATAGVIGTQRLQYDVWGDTVNVASRLESTSEPDRIHVSQAVYEVLNTQTQPQLDASTSDAPKPPTPTFTPRGMTDLKGKGEMNTWFME